MKQLREILNRPYDLLKDKAFRWWIIFGSTLFCFVFLWIFEPYGLYHLTNLHDKMFLISMYTIGTVVFSCIYFSIQDFIIKKHTVGNTVLWIGLYFLSVGFINSVIHEYMFNGGTYRLSIFVYFQWAIFSIIIIPVSTFVLIHYNMTLRKRLKVAISLNANLPNKPQNADKEIYQVIINSENGKERTEIPISNLLYITSLDNYIDIYFHKEGAVAHHLVRYSLSGIETDNTEAKDLFRCHKSYIVNKRKIESLSGNAAGYRIKLLGCDTSIPVSRKLNKHLSALIAE